MNHLVCLDDFEKEAEKRLSKTAFGFFQGAADDQQTATDNRAAFSRYRLRPRLMRDVSQRDTSVTVLGHRLPSPIAIGPAAFHKLAHPDGEIATVKGAAQASAPFCLACVGSNTKLEDVAEAVADSPMPLWLQMYVLKDRDLTVRLIKRAENAGYQALFVTVDAKVMGTSQLNKRQFTLPPSMIFANLQDERLTSAMHTQGDSVNLHSFRRIYDTAFAWKDLKWLRSVTTLPIVLKGILTAEDAREAVKYGVNGIIVSNHGGRHLDGTLATIDALSEVVNAVQGSGIEVFLDGGVRLGTDVLKALALGAKAVFIAKPAVWGLACGGEEGVTKVINLLKDEFDSAMALSGCVTVNDITPDLVQRQTRYISRL